MAARYNYQPNQRVEGSVGYSPAYSKLVRVAERARVLKVPEEITSELDNVIGMIECLGLYVDKHCSSESDTLREIRLATINTDWKKLKEDGELEGGKSVGMMTGKVEGEFLKLMVSMQQAKRVLDIGMFTGYSALAMAEAVPADGVVVTCDLEQYLQTLNRKKFDESPHGSKIDIRIGDAKDNMRSMADEGQKFDFIFVDANKEDYIAYYNIIMDQSLLAPNGSIVFDNALRAGRAYLTESDPSDALNRHVDSDPRVRRVLIPLRDGMLLVRRAEEVVV